MRTDGPDPMTFREALVWHLENYPQKISEIEAETGVSRDQLYRVKTGKSASTNADDALKVARFYGKTLEEFVCPSATEASVHSLWSRLTEEERTSLVLQMRWMVERREQAATRAQILSSCVSR